MARRKTIIESQSEEVVADKEPQSPREYRAEDLIPCQSLTAGPLNLSSPKSGFEYRWEDSGDIRDVSYEDLIALRQIHSKFLYKPAFMIMDEELLSQPRWRDLDQLYKSYAIISLTDVEKIIALDANSLEKALNKLLPAMRKVIVDTAATMIENGSLDSIARIKAIDKVCGTDLYTLAFK